MAQPLSEDPLYGADEPEFDPDKIEFRKFGTARRGYSPDEVRPYLAAIADALRDSQRREGEMRSRLGKAIRRADQAETELESAVEHLAQVEAQSQQIAAAPGDITDAELTERLGEQVAQVLHSAREAAETRVSQAQLRAREMFEAAEAEVTDIRWRAELVYGEKTTEAEAAAEQIISAARQDAENVNTEATEIIAEARVVASDLLVAAQVEGEGLIQQAQEARFQILSDMDKKRRTMRSQAERLKAGRDRLLQSHGVVQDTLNEIANELRASVAEAKIKGDTAARTIEGEEPAGPEALHSEIADAALIGTIDLPEVERYEQSEAAQKVDAFGRTGELADLRGEFTEVQEDVDDEAVEVAAVSDDDVRVEEEEHEAEAVASVAEEIVWAADPVDDDEAAVVASEEEPVVPVAVEDEATLIELPDPVAADEIDIDAGEAEVAAAIEELEAAVAEEAPAEAVVEEAPAVEEAQVVEEAAPAEALAVVDEAAKAEAPLIEIPAEVAPEAIAVDEAETREEARIIRVVDPRDSIRVLDSADSAGEAAVEEPAAANTEAATVAVAALADSTGFEVAPVADPASVEEVAPVDPASVEEVAPVEVDADAGNPMDSLFSRLRSKRDGTAEAEPAPVPVEEAAAEVIEPATDEAPEEAPELVAAETTPAPSVEDDAALVAERDAAIGDLQGTIERRLKRVLADEQNHVLEAINDRKRKTPVLDAMPPSDTHADMYVAAVVPQIEACFRAGASFADPLAVVGIPNNGPFVESLAAVIEPVRAMIGELADTPEDDDATATVRTFYRTFKKNELAIAASSVAVQAFSLGSLAAMADGAPVRWVFFDHEEGCPDGYDNSLSPAQPMGEQFPSGSYHPPTSPRCRCVLVPADR